MRILVTGAAGLIGGQLVRALQARHEVVAVVRTLDSDRSEMLRRFGATLLAMDLSADGGRERPDELDGVEVVVHLAQSARYREFPAGVDDLVAVNVAAAARLARWAAEVGARRFIHASSGSVYGPSPAAHLEQEPIPGSGLGMYPASKVAVEQILQSFSSVMSMVAVRPFFVYGLDQAPNMLMKALVASVGEGRPIVVRGDEQGLRFNPIHATDAARALVAIIDADRVDPLYNIAGAEMTTIREVAETIGVLLDVSPVFEAAPGPIEAVVGDIERIAALAGRPLMTLEQGLAELCGR